MCREMHDSCAGCMSWCAEICHMSQVRGNADYIVDGLCRQLRHLEDHSRCSRLLFHTSLHILHLPDKRPEPQAPEVICSVPEFSSRRGRTSGTLVVTSC